MVDEPLGVLLRRLRTTADLTLETLSEISGVSVRTISDIERGVSLGPRRRTVELLVDALGVDHDDRRALTAAARAGRLQPGTSAPGLSSLPRNVTDFAGRDLERARIAAHLTAAAPERPCPVAVVSGPPGFGKTSLAVQVATDTAARFDEVHFVDLRGYDEQPVDVLSLLNVLVHAVAPRTGAVAREIEQATALWHSVLADRRVLLVLDSVAAEDQVRAAVPPTGPSAVIVTTRGTLAGLEDVLRVNLAPLRPAESEALLGRIVPAAQTAGQDLGRLAALCGNVPLALRIAGNRLASREAWTVDDLVDRLAAEDRRLDALRAGDLEIRAAMASSYERVSAQGRQLFRRLALLRAESFAEPTAARLVSADLATASDALDELTELGLVQAAPRGRYQLHDLVRLFAQARLHDEEPQADRIATETDLRHWALTVTIAAGRWFEPGFESAPPERDPLVALETSDQAQDWLRSEAGLWLFAVRESAGVGEHRLVVEVAESLHWFSDLWAYWGHWHEVFALSTAAARTLGDDSALATHLGYLSWAQTFTLLEPELALASALEAGEVATRAGDPRQRAWAANYAGSAYRYLGRYDESALASQRAADLFAACGDTEGNLQAVRGVSLALRWAGRLEESIANERAVQARLDDPSLVVSPHVAAITRVAGLTTITLALVDLQRWEEALATATHTLDLLEHTDVVSLRQRMLESRIRALAALDRMPEAQADQTRLIRYSEAVGDTATADGARGLLPDRGD
ncbi:helix-turn-helix domain-containing protein [Jatrophihabitans sp. YIM 134969]